MAATLTAICAVLLLIVLYVRRRKDRRQLELHSITPEALHALLASNLDLVVLDVRQPLDLLGASQVIPGAKWLSPKQVLEDPSLIPKDKDLVVYCTCPSDETSRTILRRALGMGFLRIKFLKGGLDGWIGKGFPVEPYEQPFQLTSAK